MKFTCIDCEIVSYYIENADIPCRQDGDLDAVLKTAKEAGLTKEDIVNSLM